MTSSALPSIELLDDFSSCQQPIKRIFTGGDIPAWLESEAYSRLMTVMVRLNAAIRGKRMDEHDYPTSAMVVALVDMLDRVESWVDEIPLDTRAQRFGNRAFRDWGARLEERSQALHEEWLPASHSALLPELLYYFNNAFGNWTRIDYGSGHELSFLGFLTILRYTGLLEEQDEVAMVFKVFDKYLNVCRKLQRVYRLEPAGSKGVWGLEDHQFLNLLWGSSQLIGQSAIPPSQILQPISESSSSAYMFLSSISHITSLKRGPFNEHSPILYSIATTVPNWNKVNSGLMKMYQAEVLEKHPVVQHFWFGSILPWKSKGTLEDLPSTGGKGDSTGEHGSDDTADRAGAAPPSSGTRVPWATPSASEGGDAHPIATTAAPWAMPSQPSTAPAMPSTSRAYVHPPATFRPPPSSVRSAALLRSVDDGPTRLPNTGRPFQQGRTLASTGSAAAMSSPMGVISQPGSGQPGTRQARQ